MYALDQEKKKYEREARLCGREKKMLKQAKDLEGAKKATEKEKRARERARELNETAERIYYLRKDGDPIRKYIGSAYKSFPEETFALEKRMNQIGVKIVHRNGVMAYSPSGHGPGTIIIDDEASYSAWLHETTHAEDDYKSGWKGLRLFIDPEKAIEIENRAYDIEIAFAKELGYNDVVERLENLKEHRRRELLGEYDL